MTRMIAVGLLAGMLSGSLAAAPSVPPSALRSDRPAIERQWFQPAADRHPDRLEFLVSLLDELNTLLSARPSMPLGTVPLHPPVIW